MSHRARPGGWRCGPSQEGIPALPARPARGVKAALWESAARQETRAGSRAGQGQPLDVTLGLQGAPEGISASAAPRSKFLGRPPRASASRLLHGSELVASPDACKARWPYEGDGGRSRLDRRGSRGRTDRCVRGTDTSTPGARTNHSTGQRESAKPSSKTLDAAPLDSFAGSGAGRGPPGTARQLRGGSWRGGLHVCHPTFTTGSEAQAALGQSAPRSFTFLVCKMRLWTTWPRGTSHEAFATVPGRGFCSGGGIPHSAGTPAPLPRTPAGSPPHSAPVPGDG